MDSQVVLSPYMVGMKRMENLKGSLWNKGGDSTEGNGNTNGSDGQESFTRSFKRQKLEHTASSMPLAFTSPSPRSLTSTTHQPNKHRRRVHIQEDQTTEHHAPSEHSVFDEKAKLWYTREDFTVTLQSMKDAIRSPKETPDDCSLPNYGETLASTYLACCLDSNSSVSSCIPTSITPVHLEMLGIGRGDHRGMETCALPRLAAERNQKRREIIQNVVFLDKTLCGVTEREEFVRSISEQLTAPSRKFAQAMGISDTLSALATYAEEGRLQPRHCDRSTSTSDNNPLTERFA